MKKVAILLTAIAMIACTNTPKKGEDMNSTLKLTQEWDKIFPKSDKVEHQKVTFKNRYGITLAADLYTPKNISGKASLCHCRRRSLRGG